jgi:signal transduction histidine kinase
LAIVVGSTALIRHSSTVESVLHAISLALENVKLQADVLSQLEHVRESRIRLVDAAIEERRRIERDLHDGVQQRLLALQLRLGVYRRTVNVPSVSDVLNETTDELRMILADLRDIAHGIHPSELRQFGISGALAVMVDRCPLRMEVDSVDKRYPSAIEAALYFLISEGVVNAVRHSGGSVIRVHIAEVNGVLDVEIVDDGNGGAGMLKGHGLEGLADRIRTLGGTFRVGRATPSGSVLAASIPTFDALP